MPANTLMSIKTQDRLRAVADGEYREQLASVESLPRAVVEMDTNFAELVDESTPVACRNTCVSGLTILCDGYTL